MADYSSIKILTVRCSRELRLITYRSVCDYFTRVEATVFRPCAAHLTQPTFPEAPALSLVYRDQRGYTETETETEAEAERARNFFVGIELLTSASR